MRNRKKIVIFAVLFIEYVLLNTTIMVINKKVCSAVLGVSLLAFITFVAYILCINQEVFYTAHDRSEFLHGSTFFNSLMSKPFGLIQYVGAWLTQYFYYPALGSGLLVLIWALIFFVGAKAFRLKGSALVMMILPIACLLTSVVDLGYWIYVYTIRGYWFSQSLGYLIMILILWGARKTPRKWHFVWYLIGFLLFPILGWFALLFVLCLALVEKPTWREILSIVVLAFTGKVWHELLYSNANLGTVLFAGFPRFMIPSNVNESLSIPFWGLAAVSVFIPLCSKYLNKFYVPILCTIAGVVFTLSFMYHDKNYIDEMRMAHYAESDNWKEVIGVVEEAKSPTCSMIMLKNVALMNEGQLLERSFKMGNEVTGINNPDSVSVSFLEIAAPLVYYNYGMLNEGFRLSFECAVQSGFSPVYLKMLARCANANGEKKLAERYITQLHHHPFYSDWQPAPMTKTITELHNAFHDEITGVESSDSYIVTSLSLWYESDSKLASEQALFYSMLRRDSKRFWASFRKFIQLHMGETFPTSVAEAYVLYLDKKPEKKRVMIPVNEDMVNRYKQFWSTLEKLATSGKSRGEVAEQMRLNYGDTFWYYNIFSRRVY